MRPLPPVDALKGVQGHALVDVVILGDLPIFLECVLPGRVGQRGHRADDGYAAALPVISWPSCREGRG